MHEIEIWELGKCLKTLLQQQNIYKKLLHGRGKRQQVSASYWFGKMVLGQAEQHSAILLIWSLRASCECSTQAPAEQAEQAEQDT